MEVGWGTRGDAWPVTHLYMAATFYDGGGRRYCGKIVLQSAKTRSLRVGRQEVLRQNCTCPQSATREEAGGIKAKLYMGAKCYKEGGGRELLRQNFTMYMGAKCYEEGGRSYYGKIVHGRKELQGGWQEVLQQMFTCSQSAPRARRGDAGSYYGNILHVRKMFQGGGRQEVLQQNCTWAQSAVRREAGGITAKLYKVTKC